MRGSREGSLSKIPQYQPSHQVNATAHATITLEKPNETAGPGSIFKNEAPKKNADRDGSSEQKLKSILY